MITCGTNRPRDQPPLRKTVHHEEQVIVDSKVRLTVPAETGAGGITVSTCVFAERKFCV